MKKLLGIVVLGLLWCNLGFSIDLSEYPEEERKQYKQIKKLKEDGVTGKKFLNEKYWIKDKENFYHNIAAFHTGIKGLRIKNKTMPILGIKVGRNWSWRKGEDLKEQIAFSAIGKGAIHNGEMGMIKSKEHAWHGKEFYQITGSYENCNPQYWEFKECMHHGGSIHNESVDLNNISKKKKGTLKKDGDEAWMHIATKPVRNILFPKNRSRKFHIMQCHPKGHTITFMITFQEGKLWANLQFSEPYEKRWVIKEYDVNEHNGSEEWTSITIHLVNSTKSDKGKFTVWIDGNEKPIVEYKGRTTIKKQLPCRLHAGIYVNGALTAVDKHTAQDPTVWADAVAIAKTKKKLFELIKKKDK